MAVCPDFMSSKDELDRSILNLEKETFVCYYYTLKNSYLDFLNNRDVGLPRKTIPRE